MADVEKAKLQKVKTLLGVLQELREKETTVLAELDLVLEGGATIGVLLKQAEAAFAAAWAKRYPGSAYVWAYTKDRPQMKRLVLQLGLVELVARFDRYIGNGDPFFRSARHSFGIFAHSVNQHAAEGQETDTELHLDSPAPGDCKHKPPCTSDQEHTKRKMADARGAAF